MLFAGARLRLTLNANPPTPTIRSFARDRLALVAVAAAGAVCTVVLTLLLRGWERHTAQSAVQAAAGQRIEVLHEALSNSLEALHAVGAFFQAGGTPPDRIAFHNFVSPLLARRPELQALSWTPRVSAAERGDYERRAREDGLQDFVFTEGVPGAGNVMPAGEHPVYYPVYYIEPAESNLTALGYDLHARLDTLDRARDLGQAVSTPPTLLVQEQGNHPGFIVYLPLYAQGTDPATPDGRREQLTGFVAAVFRIPDLVDPSLARLPGLRVVFADATSGGTVNYAPPALDDDQRLSTLHPVELRLHYADRDWAIRFTPTAAFRHGLSHWQSWAVFAAGLTITVILLAYLRAELRARRAASVANASLQIEVQERKRAEEAAAAANRAKSDFLASLSHEIRTPLNSILGYTQILERDPGVPHRQRDAVGALANSGRHLLGLLNSILDLSKIEAGRMEVQRGVFDLIELVGGIVEMFKPRCAEKHLTIRTVLPPAVSLPVVGDEGKLRQILINLIGNAVKFTPRGEIIVALIAEADERWRFDVVDTGIGLAPDERAGLFAPFHQTPAGRRLGGTGLGLAIARRQVELLGGRIEVQSEPGVGTRFHFTLQLPAAVLHPLVADRPLPRLADGVRARCLVVDDNLDNRRILARLLADIGCTTASAAGAAEALDIVAREAPDIVFLDVLLGDTTGPEVLVRLREAGLPADVPAVYHTAALLGPEDRESLRRDGGGLLVKPFRTEDLCTCLQLVDGIRFDDTPPPVETPTLDLEQIVLPEDLCTRMTVAAELHSTTVLKACLDELRQLGGPAEQLADHLRQLLRAFDLGAIARLLSRLRVEPPSSPTNRQS